MQRYGAVLEAALAGVLLVACHGPQSGPGLEPPIDDSPGLTGSAGVSFGNTGQTPDQVTPVAGAGAAGTTTGAGSGAPQAGAESQPPPLVDTSEDDAGVAPDASQDSTTLDDAFFVGSWVVEQPFHALYEATLYRFAADGALFEDGTANLGGDQRVTGSVADAGTTLCTFASQWRSAGERRLVIELECNDTVAREATLQLGEGDPATGVGATVELVDGESGWDHRDFDWQWRKCPEAMACQPF